MTVWFLALATLCASPFISDPLPPTSVADTDGAQAAVFNPSGLGQVRGWEARGYYTSNSRDGENHAEALTATWKGLGLGYQAWHDNSLLSDIYSVSYGRRILPALGLGAGYHSVQGSPVWDAGMLLRPSRFMSLGARAWDIMRMPSYSFGLALRPLGFSSTLEDRLTVSADYKDGNGPRSWLFGASVEPIRGVILLASMEEFIQSSERSIFHVGLEINFSRFGLGSFSRVLRAEGYDGQVSSVRLSQAQWPTALTPRGRYVALEIEGELPEQAPARFLLGKRGLSHLDVIRAIERAGQDPSVKGLLVTIKNTDMGIGKVQELRDSLLLFRGRGKKVISYIVDSGTKGYYLASAGDEILMNPLSHLDLVGLYARALFFQETLKKVGLEFQFERKGRFKSYPESFTERKMSPEHREEVESILTDIYDQMAREISEERKMPLEDLRRRIERGPYVADEAIKEGLVDQLIYEDELRERIGRRNILDVRGYSQALLKPRSFRAPSRITVLYISGMIAEGKSFSSPLGEVSGSATISEAIREAREDSQVAAIILRVNSGGGSVMASEEIRREVVLTKGKKPVIVSMGDMAASGGYFLACPGDTLLAESGSLTGSIGVFGGKLSLEGLLRKLGIDVEVVKRGKHADVYSLHRGLDEEERAALERYIAFIYNDFKMKVAEGRKKTPEEIEAVAQGRVWNGRQAVERGLVDGIGGLSAALNKARLASGIGTEEEVQILERPEKKALWLPLMIGTEDAAALQGWKRLLELLLSERGEPLLLMPYWIEFTDADY